MNEIWKDVVGYEGIYEVSNLGNIRKFTTKRMVKPSLANKYAHVTLCRKTVHKTIRVHRIVAQAFLPKIVGKDHVNHINGNKHDNRLVNLEWVTQKENNLHSFYELNNVSPMLKKSHKAFESPSCKITSIDTVLEFDRLNKAGISSEVIGKQFNINGSTVRKHLRKFRKGELKNISSKVQVA